MPLIRVTVQPSGMPKEFDVPEGGAPCDVLALQLKEEFGSGSLHHAGSHTALLPLANVYLQAGDYDYRTFAAAAAAAAPAAAGLIDDIARLLRPIQQLVVAVYDNQHLPTQSQASSANQRLRHQVFAAYSANSDSGQESWCVVTGLWWPSLARAGCPYVRAAHIMGRATPAIDWAAMDLGPSPDVLPNVVPMMAGVERAFDSYRMCAVPSRDPVTEDVSFEIHILDPALMTQPVYQEFAGRFKQDHEQWTHPSSRKQQRLGLGDLQATELTFGQLHKQPLVFLGGRRPARRCFTYHAFWALRHAGVRGWDAGGLVIDESHFGWLSPTFESRLHATALWARMQSVQALGAGSDGVSSAADEEAAAAGHH